MTRLKLPALAGVLLALLSAALAGPTPARAQFLTPLVASQQRLDPSATALFAAMTVKPDAPHARAINSFIVGLKSSGLWSTIDLLQGWCALHDSQASLINWPRPSQIGTAVNGPNFTANVGWLFDGVTNYVNTNWTASTNAVNVTATSALIGVYERTNQGTNSTSAGVVTTSPARLTIKSRVGSTANGSAMSAIIASTATTADSRGLTVFNRLAGVFTYYKNGALFDTVAPSPTNGTLPTLPVFVGGENSAGSLSNPGARNIAGIVIASGWSATQQATFYALAQTCMTAIGAGV